MCEYLKCANDLTYIPLQQQPFGCPHIHPLNIKSEVDRRKTFKNWRVPYMDVNKLAAAGFFYTTIGDVVRRAFFQVQVGHWIEGDDAFKDNKRWSPSCEFVNAVFVGNISAPSKTPEQQPSDSYDVCGRYTKYIPKTTRSERGKYVFTFIYVYLFISSYV
jgi:hypothetical protein